MSGVFVVALAHVTGEAETQAANLAAIVGTSTYDARLWLKGLLPRIIFRSESRDDALSVLRAVTSRGSGAVMCNAADAVPTTGMARVRKFLLDDLGISANGPEGEVASWGDFTALVHVLLRTSVERTTREKVMVHTSHGTAVTVDRDFTSREHDAEHALYFFLRDGARPWCMLEHDARYLGLGDRMGATNRENFERTLEIVRSRATRAAFDDRFAFGDMPVSRNVAVRGHEQPNLAGAQPRESDLLIHLLQLWLTRDPGTPYR